MKSYVRYYIILYNILYNIFVFLDQKNFKNSPMIQMGIFKKTITEIRPKFALSKKN